MEANGKKEKNTANRAVAAERKTAFEISPEKTAELRSIVRHMIFGTDYPIPKKPGKPYTENKAPVISVLGGSFTRGPCSLNI